jgi:hypothetical protein
VPAIQQIVLDIKKLEREGGFQVGPAWCPQDIGRVNAAEIGAQQSTSTYEWSVDRSVLNCLFQEAGIFPTVDGFALQCNALCQKFFSRFVQPRSAGVKFFSQQLLSTEVYFCCPPVHLIVPCFRRLIGTPQIRSWLLIPEWKSAGFWPIVFPLPAGVKAIYRLRTGFFFANKATSKVFHHNPNFAMIALLIQT